MRELLSIKLWAERRMYSRNKWAGKINTEHFYSMTWGNKNNWVDEKKRLARSQRRMTSIFELEH
jgi:hypothetical protein